MLARLLLLSVSMLAACQPQALRPSAFDRFGGEAAVQQVAADLVERLLVNPRIAHHFEFIDSDNLRDRLAELFCVELGGGCEYQGLSMVDAHLGLDINEAEFNALVEDLQAAMTAQRIPLPAQNALLARLAPMRPDIIHQ